MKFPLPAVGRWLSCFREFRVFRGYLSSSLASRFPRWGDAPTLGLMKLHQLHMTLFEEDLSLLLRTASDQLDKVGDLSVRLAGERVIISGTVKHVVTVEASLHLVPRLERSVLSLAIERVDAVGPMGAMLLPALLGVVNRGYGHRGVSASGRAIVIDLERLLASYGWQAAITAGSLVLHEGAIELELAGALTPPA